jgi:positive regulator of sigma E activity
LISQIVEVVETNAGSMVIKPVEQGCQTCSSGGCGVSNLSQLFGKRDYSLKVANTGDFRAGDTAELLLDESLFVRSVSLQYLLPLVSMISFVMLTSFITSELVVQSVAALVGLVIGVFISRFLIRLSEDQVGNAHLHVRRIS